MNAPITMEVYSDFQCPACKTLHEQLLRPLIKDYVLTGKVLLVHREYPLTMHNHSREAATYATAAARLDKYDQVSDALFAGQAVWSVNGKVEETVFRALSPEEAAQVRVLVKEPAIAAEIERDVQSATAAGIRQTPTLVVTHGLRRYPLPGNLNYDLVRRLLDDLLAK